MITDQNVVDKLIDAAELLYRNYYRVGKGFYGGVHVDVETNKSGDVWNSYPESIDHLTTLLGRNPNKYETTIISLAIGDGPTPAMNQEDREYSLAYCWPKGRVPGKCVELMTVMCSF